MSLALRFLIALMGLVAALIGYQTQLLGLAGDDSPTRNDVPNNEYIDPNSKDDDCVYDGSYDACGGSR